MHRSRPAASCVLLTTSPDNEDREEPAVSALRVAHGPVVEHHVRDGAHKQPDHEIVEHAKHLPPGAGLRRTLLLLHRPGFTREKRGTQRKRLRLGCGLSVLSVRRERFVYGLVRTQHAPSIETGGDKC